MTEPITVTDAARARSARVRELNRLPKRALAEMHVRGGGLMGLAVYLKWTKDELLNEILAHEGLALNLEPAAPAVTVDADTAAGRVDALLASPPL